MSLAGKSISELQYITVETLETGRVQGYNKGKIRDVYLPDILIRELKKFCREEKENDGIIFRGRGGDPINRITVYKMIAYLGDMVGIKKEKVHPHSFRHFFAISYMERYGNLAELADLLGHKEDEKKKPHLGKNPFANAVGDEIIVKTSIDATKYCIMLLNSYVERLCLKCIKT